MKYDHVKDENPIENITKIDAAKRQLQTAIKLFFEEGDTISIHALSSNAHSILSDIGKLKKIESMKNYSGLKPEKKDEFMDIIHEPQNYFKHGRRDLKSTFEFRPAVTPFYILDSLHIYSILTGNLFSEGFLFLKWYYLKYPDLLGEDIKKQLVELDTLSLSANDLDVFNRALQISKQKREVY